ncbi:hypothetical protein [Frigoribacterium sp. PhB24]|uniref:hypothetical protein n=1 Tax=Frigoribacterium sp. PhB24 TaxID=2485204 RepID=UPI000FAF291F|nr:hypothetical protein [Frigoribacterium sp. PhB24]ROS54057.1 hypothetical protein EDF50_0131 [Frigoribacterium sp. PhB24]
MSDHPDADHRGDTDLDVVGPDDPQEARPPFAAGLDEIESLPLASRAEAFGEIHDELRAVLEGTAGDGGQAGR